jgi:hypothetical protein
MFALACESGQTLRDVPFKCAGGAQISVDRVELGNGRQQLDEPVVEPGGIIFTTMAKPTETPLFKSHHFLVKATMGPNDPLYLSKLGPAGSVVLSTLAESLKFYPAKTVGIAKQLGIVRPHRL